MDKDKDNIITFKVNTFKDIFTENELNMIENDMMVQSYKDDALNNHKKFIKFTIPIGEDIKLFTRGSAIEGQDITALVKYMNLPEWNEMNKYIKKNKKVMNILVYMVSLTMKKKVRFILKKFYYAAW